MPGVEMGLRQALTTGTINHLFGTKTASLPPFGKCHLSEQTILNELASTELNEYFEHLFQSLDLFEAIY
ncbi:hypothetical protein SARC_06746 [Sphaeroforma arctica JP610]|uniref:Uncharacterized protein n=1 Tax=Sphaeroforma arctica JP610 TaxID=667725 RepID=A0A0L0FVM4_9EUKA|nr:hypothetical protein SARC_06746 [Sphaeroforma arctica JP610]KNC80905.1 hypothetical protein SARC_06746 [Sphaeroforma arctica JP610]|eukprot:XP_014154807.1 hypothetical protein SARC_06746 [Sphaeroforma arctica JP610]